MARKQLGYVELEWTCPSCGTRNPGTKKVCGNCGAAQPADVVFEQAAQESLIEDEELIKAAEAGPDIHCEFCGTRNAATNKTCVRCGADLTGGQRRAKGTVLGSHRDQPAPKVKCAFCGTENDASNAQCANCGAPLGKAEPRPSPVPTTQKPSLSSKLPWIIAGIVGLLAVLCIGFFLFMSRTDAVTGRVTDVSWERSIVILGLGPATYSTWEDEIPFGAEVGSCREQVRYTSDSPQPNSVEVCGEPYTVDTGTGIGEVVQDCEYQVYDDFCSYTVMEMQPVGTARLDGRDMSPEWPQPVLEADQELGNRDESYTIEFDVDGERYTYRTSDADLYARLVPGSEWTVQINQFGNIVGVERTN